jgi:catechol 2,3-dioxygenase-like lactoylglutathione lyase family enzyme
MSVGQVMIFVSTLSTARKVYCDLLDLEVQVDMSNEGGMLILKNEGAYLTLHEGFRPQSGNREVCGVVPIFRVKNVSETRARFKSANLPLFGDIQETPVHRYQAAQDLDGNRIEFAEFK